MGILTATGASAAALLSRRTTANIEKLLPGQCRYTFLLDLLRRHRRRPPHHAASTPARRARPQFLVVPNAATAPRIFDLFRKHRLPDTELARHNGAATILALQGPRSRAVLERLSGWSLGALPFYHARWFPKSPGAAPSSGSLGAGFPEGLSDSWLVSRTGYTGELGYEIFVPAGGRGPPRAPARSRPACGPAASAPGTP